MRFPVVMAGLLLPALSFAQATGTAVFAGTVVDSAQHPLPGAEVSLPSLSISRLSDENGNFRITGLPAGSQHVVVRRIGFGLLDTTMLFVDGQTLERRITLGRIVRLDSVVVKAVSRLDPGMTSFEENRAKGFGRFITRVELDRQSGSTLGAIMTAIQGVALTRGTAGQAWIASKRSPMSRCPPVKPGTTFQQAVEQQRITDDCLRRERVYYVPSDAEAGQGVKRSCYAVVYLDRSPMNSGHPTFPFDLNTFAPDQIEAIEWYETDSQIPAQYTADARCGLLVLHRRRNG